MADAETPTHGLAERLDEDATYWRDLHAEQPSRPGYDWMIELAERQEAAAAQLRQLDRIKAALGDVDLSHGFFLSRHADACSYCSNGLVDCETADLIERIADALEADDGA